MSGLTACGLDPQSAEWTTPASKTPIDYLLSLQETDPGPDKGSFEYFGFPGLYTTQDALRAISGEAFTATPLSRRTPPSVPAGTPVPHTLALDLGTRGVRVCKVPAPVGASLISLLGAAMTTASPAGCVSAVEVSAGKVTAIDDVSPANADESWLVRLDRGPQAIAAGQLIGFGEVVSVRLGATPGNARATTNVVDPAGQAGKQGKRGMRGHRGRPGKNASINCRVKHRGKKHGVSCTVTRHPNKNG